VFPAIPPIFSLPSSLTSRGDQQSNHLLYHVMNLLKTNTRSKSFELVVDLTQASSVNEPDVSAWGGGVTWHISAFPFSHKH